VTWTTVKRERISKDAYLMSLAVSASTRATCDRRHVGCVLATADGHVLGTGYNGRAPGAPHCDDAGHLMVDGHCKRTIHAEANAVAHCARRGVPIAGCVAYVTTRPCPTCLLLLMAAGCERVVYLDPYHDALDEVSDALLVGGRMVVERLGEVK
jgi:dCMP deaminase